MRLILATIALAATLPLVGCPANTATLQKAAQASENAAIVVQELETAEIAAHQQGLIPDADHQFIQQQVLTLSSIGKTVDSCIGAAGTQAGAVVCLNTASGQIAQINANGGLYLKSTEAKQIFSIAMVGLQAALAVVQTELTGQTPATPAPAAAN